jgi:hypothetical protein
VAGRLDSAEIFWLILSFFGGFADRNALPHVFEDGFSSGVKSDALAT